jgi:tetratricopeptide (TPR) repeat protein
MLKHKEAVIEFDKAIQLDSTDKLVHYNRGLALLKQEEFEEALLTFKKAFSIKLFQEIY